MTLRPSRTLTVRLTALAGVALLGVGLAGCSGSGEPDGKASASASASATAEKAAITDVTTPAGGKGDYVGAAKDVQVTTCKLEGSKWTVAGTAKNPADDTQSYRVYVSLLKGQTDTRAVKQVDVDGVASGDSKRWDTTIGTDEHGLSCVLRVERFAA